MVYILSVEISFGYMWEVPKSVKVLHLGTYQVVILCGLIIKIDSYYQERLYAGAFYNFGYAVFKPIHKKNMSKFRYMIFRYII